MDLAGKTIRTRYRVDEYLGSNGITQDYRVWDEQRQVNLTMKMLPERLATDKIFLRRFQYEAQRLAKLQHPNIVQFYSLEQEGRLAFMLTEFVEGESLKLKIFDARAPCPFQEIQKILNPLARALMWAHEKFDLVHGDVKPENIIIDQQGNIKLAGFET